MRNDVRTTFSSTVLPPTSVRPASRAALTCAAAILAASSASAGTKYYVGSAPNDWFNPANWSATAGGAGGAGVPVAGDGVVIAPGDQDKLVQLNTPAYGMPGLESLILSGSGGFSAGVTQTGGSLTVSNVLAIGQAVNSIGAYTLNDATLNLTGDSFNGPLAVGASGSGYLTLNGASVINSTGNMSVGISGYGNVQHSGGTINIGSSEAKRSLLMSRNVGTSSVYYLNGTSELNVHGNVQLGFGGSASMFANGGTLRVLDNGLFMLGNAAGSAGFFVMNSGTVEVSGGTIVGGDAANPGGSAILNLNGGTFNAGTGLIVWAGGSVTLGSGATLSIGSTPADNIRNEGVITNNGGTLNLAGRIYSVSGNGVVNTPSGSVTLANGTTLDAGAFNVSGGTVLGGNLNLGSTPGNSAQVTQTGGTVTVDVLGAGNNGTLAGGAGNARYDISGGTLNADTILLGSTTGGSGEMTLSGTATVKVGGGLSTNSVTMNGGTLTVLDQSPPAGEDPVLDRSIVGGYLRDGAMTVNAGLVSSPKIKLGITAGKVGTYSQTGGTVTVGVLGVGNDATLTGGSGTGHAIISGGTLYADTVLLGDVNGGSGDMTVSGTASVTVGGGLSLNDLTVNGGSVTVLDQNPPAGEDPVLNRAMVGGYLHDGAMFVNGGTVRTPRIKLGITGGKVGTYAQTNGNVGVTVLGVGNDATATAGAGVGRATLSGGTLTANTLIVGSSAGGDGAMNWTGGTLNVATLNLTGVARFNVGTPTGVRRTLKVDALSIDGNAAALDLNNGSLIVDYAPTGPNPVAAVRAALVAGYNGGNWHGTHGIISGTVYGSVPIDDGDLGIGYGLASDLYSTFPQTFGGMTIDATSVLVRMTFDGDATLDGAVTFDDLLAVAQHYGQLSNMTWTSGDFNYDGAVVFDDLLSLAQNYNRVLSSGQISLLAGTGGNGFAEDWSLARSLVPEPACSLGLLLSCAAARRRRG